MKSHARQSTEAAGDSTMGLLIWAGILPVCLVAGLADPPTAPPADRRGRARRPRPRAVPPAARVAGGPVHLGPEPRRSRRGPAVGIGPVARRGPLGPRPPDPAPARPGLRPFRAGAVRPAPDARGTPRPSSSSARAGGTPRASGSTRSAPTRPSAATSGSRPSPSPIPAASIDPIGVRRRVRSPVLIRGSGRAATSAA